jgi:hypothetical protein
MRRWIPVLLVAVVLLAWAACRAPIRRDPGSSASQPPVLELEPFRRTDWGNWIDEDHDCQNTRTEVLIAESLRPVTFKDARRCSVAAGLWRCPYTGREFVDPHDLDVDHMVPLKNAHASGGHAWARQRRTAYANDLDHAHHLVAVSSAANRSKGSRSPAEWLPRQRVSWCWYASSWHKVKERWGLTMNGAEAAKIREIERGCALAGRD